MFAKINAFSQATKQPLKTYWKAASIVAVALLSLWAPIAFKAAAVHSNNLFELGGVQAADILGDGNAANGPDWADIFNSTGGIVNLYGGVAAAFIKDDLSQSNSVDQTTFSGAGTSNKNTDPISAADCVAHNLTGSDCNPWHWDSGNTPAKDDLSNVYAYATINPADGHLIVYAGFERLDPSGDSHVDIEFLQSGVSLDEAVPCNDPGSDVTPCNFEGIRNVGDVIASMEFSQGGALGSVNVRRWDGTSYVLVATVGGEGCNAASGSIPADAVCAFNNGGNINGGPWDNFNRHGAIITNLPQNSFTEYGADITALTGGVPCLSTIMGKTRSSDSFTSELKDFAGPHVFESGCGANISINPSAFNEVGQSHTFTVTVNQVIGNIQSPANDGTIVNVTLTDGNGASHILISDNCISPGTVNGTCSVTFTSNSAGTVTGHASADVLVSGSLFFVETDGVSPNSGDAVKTFVDAKISIAPDDTNSVSEDHTFQVTVQQDDGSGAGFVNAPNGTIVTVTLTDAGGAVNSVSSNTCSTGTVGGVCSITFTSQYPGTVTGHATVTFSVAGVSLTRSTDGSGQNSDDAVKTFVAGSLRWTKVDNAGQLQGGATFEVCRTANFNSDTLAFDPITPVCISVADDTDGIAGPGPDQDPDAGEFLLTGLRLGTYTVHETIAPPGFSPDPDTVTVNISLASPNAVISEAFQNERPILKLTEFGYTNTPVGTPTSGVVSGITVYTLKIKNFGTATAILNFNITATATGLGGGTFTCTGGCSQGQAGVSLAPGAEITFTLSVEYTNAADGAVISATLIASYTLNGLTRTVSGTPATISFTVQSD